MSGNSESCENTEPVMPRWLYSSAVVLVFVLLHHNLIFRGILQVTDLEAVPALIRMSIFYLIGWLIPVLLFAAVAHRGPFGKTFNVLGLSNRFLPGWGFAFVMSLPMCVGVAGLSRFGINPDLSVTAVLGKALFPGVMEEILYRGFLFGLLFRYGRWGFIPAVLLNAGLFALSHLYQSSDFLTCLGIFAVTLMGGAWFAWLYIEWNTLWLPIGLHVFMNLWWELFSVDQTALGGIGANLFRALTIALTVVVTIRRRKRAGSFRIKRGNLIVQHK